MKYFSVNDWNNWDEKSEKVVAYNSYIHSIKSFLPNDLRMLVRGESDISLNDGEIESLSVSLETALVSIIINGKWIKGTNVGDRIFSLTYRGVISLSSTIDLDAKGLHGSGYGYHGFDEIEMIGDNLYEHRMLFTSGIELYISFQDFSLKYSDIPN